MGDIHREVIPSLIFCDIYYFSKDDERRGKTKFFAVWVHEGIVVKGGLGRIEVEKGMEAKVLVERMKEKGYQLDIL